MVTQLEQNRRVLAAQEAEIAEISREIHTKMGRAQSPNSHDWRIETHSEILKIQRSVACLNQVIAQREAELASAMAQERNEKIVPSVFQAVVSELQSVEAMNTELMQEIADCEDRTRVVLEECAPLREKLQKVQEMREKMEGVTSGYDATSANLRTTLARVRSACREREFKARRSRIEPLINNTSKTGETQRTLPVDSEDMWQKVDRLLKVEEARAGQETANGVELSAQLQDIVAKNADLRYRLRNCREPEPEIFVDSSDQGNMHQLALPLAEETPQPSEQDDAEEPPTLDTANETSATPLTSKIDELERMMGSLCMRNAELEQDVFKTRPPGT